MQSEELRNFHNEVKRPRREYVDNIVDLEPQIDYVRVEPD